MNEELNTELFGLAVDAALCLPVSGIGTLSEKKVHSSLKYYVQPDPDMHEIKTGRHVCDAVSADTLYEIQTRCFSRLKPKLTEWLPEHVVTIVYPVVTEKTVITTDVETGEVFVRKSPKKGVPADVLPELCAIRDFLSDPNLRIRLILLTAEERRECRVKVSRKGRRRYEVITSDRIPVELKGDLTFGGANELAGLIPEGLGDEFTLKEFSALTGIRGRDASRALYALCCAGAAERIGKSGRSYIYNATGRSAGRKVKANDE